MNYKKMLLILAFAMLAVVACTAEPEIVEVTRVVTETEIQEVEVQVTTVVTEVEEVVMDADCVYAQHRLPDLGHLLFCVSAWRYVLTAYQ